MSQHGGVRHTRRNFLGLAIGLLAAGCSNAMTRSGFTIPRNPNGFPSPAPWCWDKQWTPWSDPATPAMSSTSFQTELLGQLIMAGFNPYCVHPASLPANSCTPGTYPATCPCTVDDPGTWPMELTDELSWKVLTEFDFVQRTWYVPDGTPVTIERSMRIPYLIAHSVAQHGGNFGHKLVDVGRENLLVGFERTRESFSHPTLWNDPTKSSCSPADRDSVGLLAQFITKNMMDKTKTGKLDTQSFFVDGWSANGVGFKGYSTSKGAFRNTTITLDYVFSIPVATGTQPDASDAQAGRIYVGYEGGGAY
jgi:hypothetical protein